MARGRRSQLEQIGALVPRVLTDLGLESSARVLRLVEHWEEAVGPEIARHCQPTALRGEVLEAILSWTNGQPFLTQKLCQLMTHPLPDDSNGLTTPGGASWLVVRIIRTKILRQWESQD